MTLNKDFEDTLHKLEDARIADDELHRYNASLEDRVASHAHLTQLRAEMEQVRLSIGLAPPGVTGSHDSRTAKGAGSD